MGLSKPSTPVFWISLVLGAYAIVDQYFLSINIPIIKLIPNMVLLSLAFILLMLGVLFKKM